MFLENKDVSDSDSFNYNKKKKMRKTKVMMMVMAVIAGIMACSKPAPVATETEEDLLVTYENDLFSIDIPREWVCDSSGWEGLDAMHNVVDIYDPDMSLVWLHIVKSFSSIEWKDIDEAKEMAKMARAASGDSVELIHEIDSVVVGGYPSCILYFANYVDNDTIIQKQFVTYLQDSHIMVYFNENFRFRYWEKAQELGDLMIGSVNLKKVANPLDNDSILQKAAEEGMARHPLEERYKKNAERLLEQLPAD